MDHNSSVLPTRDMHFSISPLTTLMCSIYHDTVVSRCPRQQQFMTAFRALHEVSQASPHCWNDSPPSSLYLKPMNLICQGSKICPPPQILFRFYNKSSKWMHWGCLVPQWQWGIAGISLVVLHSRAALFYSDMFDKRKVTARVHPAGSTNGDSHSFVLALAWEVTLHLISQGIFCISFLTKALQREVVLDSTQNHRL